MNDNHAKLFIPLSSKLNLSDEFTVYDKKP